MPTLVKALIDHLREQGSFVLASSEDADYYRKILQSLKAKPAPVQKIEIDISTFAPPKSAPEPEPSKPIEIDPPIKNFPKVAPADFSLLRSIVKAAAPELKIIDEIPSDAIAKKISERWKSKNKSAPISILAFQEPPEQRALLEEIARALNVYFGLTKIVTAEEIENQNQWDSFLSASDLKLIISCDYTLWQLPNLMQFYKETPAKKERVLANIPLFLLPDLSLYLKDPLLKRSLWKALRLNFK